MKTLIQIANQPRVGISVLSILYFVGVVGILTAIHEQFISLTPINLIVSVTIALFFHENWNRAFIAWLCLVFLWGFFAELIGVQTGLLFGSYHYGSVLGWKVAETPLIMGVNWILVTYCAGISINHLFPKLFWVWKAALGATMMVLLDIFIEPVAIAYEFWSWENDLVPLQNYLGWWLVALPLMLLFMRIQGNSRNKVAVALFILQFSFFMILGLFEVL